MDYQSKVKSHGGLVILFHNMIDICVAAMGAGVRSLNEKVGRAIDMYQNNMFSFLDSSF